MPQIGPIAISDGQATPVNHTFSPVGINADMVATWQDRASGIPIGYNVLTASTRRPSSNGGSKNFKVQLKLVLPVLEVTSASTATGIQPAPTKAYESMAVVEFVLPERCTLQNRIDLLTMTKMALATSMVTSMVQDLENVY